MLTTIVYTSRASSKPDEAALTELLTSSRARNACEVVTGMLIYAHGSYVQQLEGEQAAVDAIFASIKRDVRHRELRLLSRRPIDVRRYEGWAMGFEHPNSESLSARLPGYRPSQYAPLADVRVVTDTETAETLLELCATCGRMTTRWQRAKPSEN
jgi:hypothetical protein